MAQRARSSRAGAGDYPWADASDHELLAMRFCDLKLSLKTSDVQPIVERLYEDLARKGLTRLRPHCWLSNEWFSPDGIPGIAVPFYLAHPRLKRLEKKQMLQVEGGSDLSCLRILRHEAGHCVDTAYRLHRKKQWRQTFGAYSTPYPDTYKPKPASRHYVTHLDWWYAQAHPAEDFAETFAVWLAPGSKWRQQYKGWPAMKKLRYVDQTMTEIAEQTPAVRSRQTVDPLSQLRKTLSEHYQQKKARYGDDSPDFYDADLRKIFSDDTHHRKNPTAASFLRRIRPELRRNVAHWTGTHRYTIDQVLKQMIDRCKELNLRLTDDEEHAHTGAMMMLTVQTMHYMLGGKHQLAL